MLKIGSLVDGKYRILSKIGSGGMSIVYMAINEKANKTWAIKELRKEGVINFEAVKNGLMVETEMLKRLHHPHLPSIVDVIEEDDSLLIVMDYIEGNSLQHTLKEYGAQSQELVIGWGKQMCDVLGYLHSRKPPIIYRDMKPGNIMLKPDGNLTLIDFGTAREFKERNLADTTCLGTIGYAAPEQFGGAGQTDNRTDIYGLGATLYHLVTGMNPSEPPYEMRPIREINLNLSSGLENIILRCTLKNPDERYQSAEELMYALENYEKIDDSYRTGLRVKFATFFVSLLLAVGFSVAAVFSQLAVSSNDAKEYQTLVDEAARTVDYEGKNEKYIKAISIPDQGGSTAAYLGLIQSYKDNDYVFSLEEAQTLEKLVSENREDLLLNKKNYVDVCFEIGKLFWYYYDYGDIENNQITRAKSAVEWFQEVLLYSDENYTHNTMAQAYSNVGIFYRDITTDITEASDQGKYLPFFMNIRQLIDNIAMDSAQSEIVRLELLELGRSSIQQYASKFKHDGVSQSQMDALLTDIETTLHEVEANTEKSNIFREESLKHIPPTRKAISTAFSSSKGGK